MKSTPTHVVEGKLLLRSAKSSVYQATHHDSPPIFPVLIDTGCSVATSGFLEDFEGNIVAGKFGQIKTANGEAEIKGFGMVSWHTVTDKGDPVVIRVPAYFAPDIPLRLFSPQDYARYHEQPTDTPSFLGNSAWFAFHHVDSDYNQNLKVIYTNRDPDSGLFYFFSEARCDLQSSAQQGEPDQKKAKTSTSSKCRCHANPTVFDPTNHNLSRTQKGLLLDHARLGHISMHVIQKLYQCPGDYTPPFDISEPDCDPCLLTKDKGQIKCTVPLCETCQFAKARRRGAKSKTTKANPDHTNVIREDDLQPGDCFSVDQYSAGVRGRLLSSRGRESQQSRWCGGTLFYDHASSKIFVRHQVSLSGTDTVNAKRSVEREAQSYGVHVKKYHTDNGIFKDSEFEEALLEVDQTIQFSGVGAKFQNGVAESAIGVVQNMSRAMLLHVRIHWPEEFDAALWPFALDYAVWIYNNIPLADRAHMTPDEIFSKSKYGCSILRRARVFGCPTYVLDARLQDGKKIPKWHPRARTGMFLGFSGEHSSLVGLVLNIKTGHISPQFHVVYDERFETVASDKKVDLTETWIDLWQNSREFYLEDWDPLVDGPYPPLDPDYDPDAKSKDTDDSSSSSSSSDSSDPQDLGQIDMPETVKLPMIKEPAPFVQVPSGVHDVEEVQETKSSGALEVEEAKPREPSSHKDFDSANQTSEDEEKDDDSSLDKEAEDSPGVERVRDGVERLDINKSFEPWNIYEELGRQAQQDPILEEPDPRMLDPTDPDSGQDIYGPPSSPAPGRVTMQRGDDDDEEEESHQRSPSPRRTRSGRTYGKDTASPAYRSVKSRLYSHVRHIQDAKNFVYATLNWESVDSESLYKHFHQLFSLQMDARTKEILDPDAAIHPFSLAAKLESEDYPSFKEILRMAPNERDKWFDSMDEELKALFESDACQFIDRAEVVRRKKEIVKSTWAFRKKRKPSGEVTRYKSRLCVRGDLQKDKAQYGPNETFAPVVEWMTVRLLFTLGLVEGWSTASVDFKNAFTQAKLPEPIYLELPPGLEKASPDYKGKLIEVKTSLYGDRRAANLWYRKIASTLVDDLKFKGSEIDPCLFVRRDCVIVLYVDDAILMSRNDASIDKVLQELKDAKYSFSREGDFRSYLGVQIENLPDGAIKMSQPHLAKSLVDLTGMSDSTPVPTPSTGPLFRHVDSKPFDQHFSYRSAIGVLQYLGNNTRPDCAYAINSCARFCIEPREPHGNAVKRIARCIKGTLDEGIIIRPDFHNLSIDCHVDADLAGNWNPKDPEDPNGVRSRTGYLLTFGGVPLLWKSKMQDCIALSTMESEYIACSMAMRSLVHIRALMAELCANFNLAYGDRVSTMSTVFEDNRAAKILATTDPPRLTPRSKSLAMKYHWFRSHLSKTPGKGIHLEDVASALNKADFLTKSLGPEPFTKNRRAVSGW